MIDDSEQHLKSMFSVNITLAIGEIVGGQQNLGDVFVELGKRPLIKRHQFDLSHRGERLFLGNRFRPLFPAQLCHPRRHRARTDDHDLALAARAVRPAGAPSRAGAPPRCRLWKTGSDCRSSPPRGAPALRSASYAPAASLSVCVLLPHFVEFAADGIDQRLHALGGRRRDHMQRAIGFGQFLAE